MGQRYPYIEFIIDAGQVIAGAIAAIIFIGGTVSACGHGGAGGFFSFLVTIVVAGAAYVLVMVRIEALRVFLDVENTTRQLLAQQQSAERTTPSVGA